VLTLYELTISHFCEKARWALDHKGLEYRARTLVPGFHILSVWRKARTQTVPVLVDHESGAVLTDSTDILHYLDRIRPDPPLFPADAELAAEVAAVEEEIDTGWGPQASSAAYCNYVRFPAELRRIWNTGLGPLQRAALGLAMPVLARGLRRRRGLSREAGARFAAQALQALDSLQERLDANGGRYLVGDAFTAADLTAAALMGPFIAPPGSPWEETATRVNERAGFPPEELVAFRDAVAARPIASWAAELWATRRHT